MTYLLKDLGILKATWLMKTSNIPHRFIGLEPSNIIEDTGAFPEEINDWLDSVLAGDVIKNVGGLGTTGVGLLFAGIAGLGKTTHAVTTIMEFIRRLPADENQMRLIMKYSREDLSASSRPVYYLTYPEFLAKKKSAWDGDYETKARTQAEVDGFHGRAKNDDLNVRILVLDDLGKEYGSSFDDASFDEILRSRYDKGLPTIVTTNKVREEWAAQYGAAMGSFAYEAFHMVTINGRDLRTGQ